ncbi:ABC transporter ATP-binding protein [Flavisphingomonas formosensis]|uniref:ABC transporter ATP-binding protein n=1 Tax=Flavisphingomonas formosensis TaxID=861534 RepID=UPI0018DF5582|nr:ABC transporter ATP-binding protein [Sphingomonas formosensis]
MAFARNGATISAVNGVSYDLARGEVLTIIGESGSGKSVMLRALLGLNSNSARLGGSIRINGVDMTQLDDETRSAMRGRDISMIFQEPSTAFDPVYTIGEQIIETVLRHEDASYAEAHSRAKEMLDLVSIPSAERRLRNFPHEMSGGMRQRAMIALALACRPSVLLADEPTTALDATVQIQILLLLRKLQRELDMALIFVTHDMGVAAEISDRVAVMYAGRFVETGSAEDVLLNASHPYTRAMLKATVHAGMRGQTLTTIQGAPPDLRALPQGCSFSPRCPAVQTTCQMAQPPSVSLSQTHMAACTQLPVSAVACRLG